MYQLEKQENGAVAVEIENAVKDKAMIQKAYGFETHGLVFFDASKTEVLKTMGGHMMKNEEIEASLREVLGSLSAS